MNNQKSTEIESIIERFKDNIESEKHLVENLGLRPCFVLKKTEQSKVFGDLHHHDLYEILYIKEGKVSYIIEDKKYILEEGDIILMPPTVLHRLESILSNVSKRIILTFSEGYVKNLSTNNCDMLKAFEISKQKKIHKISFEKSVRKTIENYFKIMNELQFSKQYGDDLTFNVRFCQTMLIINKALMNIHDDTSIVTHSNKIVGERISFINENLNKKIHIEDISKKLSLSESRLAHLFKQETGMSILRFINKKRLILAKELIRSGEHLNVVYGLCGFQDNTSFFRAFKKEYNITPRNYYLNYIRSLN
jgi:AraC-like DNA-binding protein/mannose-6-phosphate isomerase-like protein (cupin superfamily)